MKIDDLVRQLEKTADVLMMADAHFAAEARMNAALHMNSTVRPAPLASAVGQTYEDLGMTIDALREQGVQ